MCYSVQSIDDLPFHQLSYTALQCTYPLLPSNCGMQQQQRNFHIALTMGNYDWFWVCLCVCVCIAVCACQLKLPAIADCSIELREFFDWFAQLRVLWDFANCNFGASWDRRVEQWVRGTSCTQNILVLVLCAAHPY